MTRSRSNEEHTRLEKGKTQGEQELTREKAQDGNHSDEERTRFKIMETREEGGAQLEREERNVKVSGELNALSGCLKKPVPGRRGRRETIRECLQKKDWPKIRKFCMEEVQTRVKSKSIDWCWTLFHNAISV